MCVQVQDPSFVEYFSGNRLLPGSETAAHCYAGHQFGHFSGQLGDGAAIYLGEVNSPHILPHYHMHWLLATFLCVRYLHPAAQLAGFATPAVAAGQVINSQHERWEVQLKGAGPTPYSRSADGRKVLRSSIREFLASEALYHLVCATLQHSMFSCLMSRL